MPLKLLLIQPPAQDFYDTDIRLQPLGLCMLKGAVEQHLPEVNVVVRDYHHGFGKKTVPLPGDLAYLKDYYSCPDSSPFCGFHHYHHFGAPFETIAQEVLRLQPDVVGISSLFSAYHKEALACAAEIKKRLPVPIVLGGAHVSASPRSMLGNPSVDFVIRGEGERPLVEFLKAFMGKGSLEQVPNLGFKREGRPVLNPMEANYPLDELPSPDFSDLDPNRYRYKGKRLCFVTTSRGCPHRCAFCSVRTTFGQAYRSRSPEKVVAEIRNRYDEGYRVFDFEDDNLTHSRESFRGVLEGVIRRIPAGEVELLAMNGLSYLSLDQDLLALMARAGFRHLDLSLVSSNRAVLKTLRRPHNLGKFLSVVHRGHALGFHIVCYQILGLPMEPLEDMVRTTALLAGLPVLIGASVFYLPPGCPMAGPEDMSEQKMFRARSTAMAVDGDGFCRDDLYTLFLTARILNFLKSLCFQKKEVTMREALEAAKGTRGREHTGAELLETLLTEKRLYASTSKGYKPLPKFRPDLFFRVLEISARLCTTRGQWITMADR